MKQKIFINFLILFFVLAFSCYPVSAQTPYYGNYSDVLLVCNSQSNLSQSICNYFVEKRASKGFLSSNLVNLTGVSTNEVSNCLNYLAIVSQISSKLREAGEINYIVTTSGVPLAVTDCYGNYRSVDSKLTVEFNSSGQRYNYYGSREIFKSSKFGGYIVTRLGGASLQDVKNLIDNSERANLTGYFLINNYGSLDGDYGSSYAYYLLNSKNISAEFNSTSFVMNRGNLSGYWSWGSNAQGANIKNSSSWNLSFNPGAIAETAVSTSAYTLLYTWNDYRHWQSLITDLIRFNVTGVKGYVYEPGLTCSAKPDILFDRYTEGYNLGDSFSMASRCTDWMDVIVGDPKTYIARHPASISFSLSNGFTYGERLNPGTNINFTVYVDEFASLYNILYNYNGTNLTFAHPYSINTSGWSNGPYNISFYVNTSSGWGFTSYSFMINTTAGVTPIYRSFNGNTTDFKLLSDRTNVSNAVLENSYGGKIVFTQNVNVSGLNLDQKVILSSNYLSIDSVGAPGLNVSANVTFYNSPGRNYLPQTLYIAKDGVRCNDCYNFTPLYLSSVTFNVSSFSTYSIVGDYTNEFTNSTFETFFNSTYDPYDVALDSKGNIYQVGSKGSIVKYDNNGVLRWNVSLGSGDLVYAVSIDPFDYLYVIGYFNNSIQTLKYDSNGSFVWNKTMPGATYSSPSQLKVNFDIYVDASNNIYSLGRVNSQIVVFKYDSNGNKIINFSYGGGSDFYLGRGIVVDSGNNIYITGSVYVASDGYDKQITIKLNSTGSQIWNSTLSFAGDDKGYGLAFGSLGEIYVFGASYSAIGDDYFDNTTLVKYDSNGNLIWMQNSMDEVLFVPYKASDLHIDSEGNIILSGIFVDKVFLRKINSEGVLLEGKVYLVHPYVGNYPYPAFALDSLDRVYLSYPYSDYGFGLLKTDKSMRVDYSTSAPFVYMYTSNYLSPYLPKDPFAFNQDAEFGLYNRLLLKDANFSSSTNKYTGSYDKYQTLSYGSDYGDPVYIAFGYKSINTSKATGFNFSWKGFNINNFSYSGVNLSVFNWTSGEWNTFAIRESSEDELFVYNFSDISDYINQSTVWFSVSSLYSGLRSATTIPPMNIMFLPLYLYSDYVRIDYAYDDSVYPVFYNLSDNSGEIFNSGVAVFRSEVDGTNGDVWIEVLNSNGLSTNYTSGNISNLYSLGRFFDSGNYTYRWWARGLGGNHLLNSSPIYNYTIISDLIPPRLSIISPSNGSSIESGSVQFGLNLYEDYPANCSLFIDKSLSDSPTYADLIPVNGALYKTATGLSYGSHNWTVLCRDLAGNTNNSGVYYFNLIEEIASGSGGYAGVVYKPYESEIGGRYVKSIYAGDSISLNIPGINSFIKLSSFNSTGAKFILIPDKKEIYVQKGSSQNISVGGLVFSVSYLDYEYNKALISVEKLSLINGSKDNGDNSGQSSFDKNNKESYNLWVIFLAVIFLALVIALFIKFFFGAKSSR